MRPTIYTVQGSQCTELYITFASTRITMHNILVLMKIETVTPNEHGAEFFLVNKENSSSKEPKRIKLKPYL